MAGRASIVGVGFYSGCKSSRYAAGHLADACLLCLVLFLVHEEELFIVHVCVRTEERGLRLWLILFLAVRAMLRSSWQAVYFWFDACLLAG